MPKDKWLRLAALYGIAHIAVNLGWNEKVTIKEWWTEQIKKKLKKEK